MVELFKTTGESLACESVTRGQQFPYLYVHTHAVGWDAAHAFFSDAAGLAELTAVEHFSFTAETERGPQETAATKTTVYKGFTELYCIQRSPLFDDPGELMIWLQRPEEE